MLPPRRNRIWMLLGAAGAGGSRMVQGCRMGWSDVWKLCGSSGAPGDALTPC